MSHSRTKHRPALALALVLTSVGLAACSGESGGTSADGGGGGDESLTEVRMGYVPWIGYGGWFISEEEGYFAEEGIEVSLTAFNSDAEKNNAFAAGQIDVLNIASHGALQMIEEGLDISIVLVEDISTTADAIAATGDIQSIEDLRGQAVAYEEITTSDILLNYALAEAGMTLEDIERVPMNASNAGAALIGGQVPVAVTYEPYLSEALAADPDNTRLIYTAGEAPGLISDVLVVRNDFLDENPDAVQALVNSWGRGMDFYAENTEDAQGIIAEAVGSDMTSLETAFDGVEFYDLAQNAEALNGEFSETTLPLVMDAAIAAGILSGEVDYSSAINTQFVDEAAGE